MEHCVASYRREQRDRAYRAYLTDTLKLIAEMYSVAHGGSLDLPRYMEHEARPKKGDDKSPEERAEEIKSRISEKLARLGN